MLGKVLDLSTARTFFERHESIATANAKKKEEVQDFSTKVEGLSKDLSKVQKSFLSASAKNQKSEKDLHEQDAENTAMIESMNSELARGHDVQESLKKLTKIHERLLKEGEDALKAGQKSVRQLKDVRFVNKKEVGKHKSLRE